VLGTLTALPAPEEDESEGGQYAVAVASLLAGAGILAAPLRRREKSRRKEPAA
jgi:hypothetical protein